MVILRSRRTALVVLLAVLLAYAQRELAHRSKSWDSRLGSGRFFDDFAVSYDTLNRVISLGYDRSWRDHAVNNMLPANSVLDVSTGTGDIVRALLKHGDTPQRLVGVDPSIEMLRIAQKKFSDIDFIQAAAEKLPFADAEFDGAIVSFGVRNFADRDKGLSEMVRVVRPGGKLVILEIAMTRSDEIMARAKNMFVTFAMPRLAALLSGHPFAYRYLSDSMSSFPGPKEFKEMLRSAGCTDTTHERMPPFGVGPDLYVCTKVQPEGATTT